MVACLHAIEIRKAKFFVEPDHHLANKIRHSHARIQIHHCTHTYTYISVWAGRWSVCSFVSHPEVARLFHEMELELVSLACQTVNWLGAATRAINPLLVLQFSTHGHAPPLTIGHYRNSINPRRFLLDFQNFRRRSPSLLYYYFSSPSFSLLRPRFHCPSWQEGVPRYWQERRRWWSRSRGEGNQSLRVLWSVTLEFECFVLRLSG